jgi:DNA-binding MarR family transcriptional regulator
MSESKAWYEEVVLPALLRHARNTYGVAMRKALIEAGYDDVPANGLYVIGGLALGAGDVPLAQLVRELRVSKQAAGQLVDVLVLRGYLQRAVDETDRRRVTVALTERGKAVAAVQAAARKKVDAELARRVDGEDIGATRRTLAALIEIGREREERAVH